MYYVLCDMAGMASKIGSGVSREVVLSPTTRGKITNIFGKNISGSTKGPLAQGSCSSESFFKMVRLNRDPILARHNYRGFSWKLHIFPTFLNLFTLMCLTGSVERSLGVPGAPLGGL